MYTYRKFKAPAQPPNGSLVTATDTNQCMGRTGTLLEDEPVEIQDSRKITKSFQRNLENKPQFNEEKPKISTRDGLDLETQPVTPKNLPRH